LSIDSSGQPNFRIANGITQNNLAATGASINDGSWHHVLAVLKRGETDLKEIYVDGEFINSNTQDAGWNIDSTQPLDIGTYNGNTNPAYFFPGQIDDVRIYNYALSPAQILKV